MPEQSSFTSPTDGRTITTWHWGADLAAPRGTVQIAHGLSEYGARYDRFARALVGAGYRVVASDHRGHGQSVTHDKPLGDFEFPALVADIAALGRLVKADDPALPLHLFGHSMGSFASQEVVLDHSDLYDSLVLSGSSAIDVLAAGMAEATEPVGLEAFNAGFEHRTGFEWLSRDEAEVDAYVADPLCGAEATPDSMAGMFSGAGRLGDPEQRARVRDDLPVLIASGDADPLAGGGELVRILGQRYTEAGLGDVTVRLYPGARHEILNETNRDEVTADVIDWLQQH